MPRPPGPHLRQRQPWLLLVPRAPLMPLKSHGRKLEELAGEAYPPGAPGEMVGLLSWPRVAGGWGVEITPATGEERSGQGRVTER